MISRTIWPQTVPIELRRSLERFNDEVIRFTKIPAYASNAAALAAGLKVGELYHTSGTVKVVI